MRYFLKACLCLTLLFLAACTDVYIWNQKLTVYVETPDGEISASSVAEVTITHSDGKFVFPEARGARSDIKGEAVVLEVLPGRYLFVLLDDIDQLAHSAFPQFVNRSGELGEWAKSIQNHRGEGLVPLEHYPMMVTFGDISDPTTVQLVESHDLPKVFGDGYGILKITLSITQEEVTGGIVEKTLSWWPTFRSGPVNAMQPLRLPNESPRGWQNLSSLSFWSIDQIQQFDEVNQ